jgi:hypothetical protein
MSADDHVLQFWRGILGEVPDAEKLGQLTSLNDVSPAIVAAARRLGDVRSAAGLVSSYLQPARRQHVERFVRDVVFGETAPQHWLLSRTLVPDWSFQDQVTLPARVLTEPVGGTFEHRIVPSLTDWQSNTSWIGAPCLTQPDADYLTPVPPHAASLVDARTERVDDPTVAVRRWIASRIAMVVKNRVGTDFSEAEAIAFTLVPASRWTVDARAALDGLIREARELGSGLEAPPGFRGPDSRFLQTRA